MARLTGSNLCSQEGWQKSRRLYLNGEEVDESETSGATLVVGDEVDLVDVAVLGEVTLEIATRRGVAAISISSLET